MTESNLASEHLLRLTIPERVRILKAELRALIARALRQSPAAVSVDAPFPDLCRMWTSAELLARIVTPWIKKQLGLRHFYPTEIADMGNINALANYLAREIEPVPKPEEQSNLTVKYIDDEENSGSPYTGQEVMDESAVFILGAGRSGTTLLRLMLDGHPRILSPRELNLLPFDSMGQRDRALTEFNSDWMRRGLVETISKQLKFSKYDALLYVKELEKNDKSIPSVYKLLHGSHSGDYLIDKSPSYSFWPGCLQRAEQMFKEPRYVFLTRHPYSVTSSFVHSRFHRMGGVGPIEGQDTPWLVAETNWYKCNHHANTFLQLIPRERWLHIRYEEMVTETEQIQKALCEFLKIEFVPDYLDPYAEQRPEAGGVDSTLQKSTKIDPELADVWKKRRPPQQLNELTSSLALELGYELGS